MQLRSQGDKIPASKVKKRRSDCNEASTRGVEALPGQEKAKSRWSVSHLRQTRSQEVLTGWCAAGMT